MSDKISGGVHLRLVVVAALAIAFTGLTASANGETPVTVQTVTPSDPDSWEAATTALSQLIKAQGALDSYVDDAGTVVVVVPSSGSSSFSVADAAALGLGVRIETQDLEPQELAHIIDVAKDRSWHPDAGRYSMGIYFDARMGKILIEGNAPAEIFRPLEDQFPNLIDHRFLDLHRTSRYADYQPHWGGAWMKRQGSPNPVDCTSGFSVLSSLSNQRMVTAAHCFTLDTVVNSPGGTSFGHVTVRKNYPTNDFEMIGGGSITQGPAIYVGLEDGVRAWVQSAGNTGFNVQYCFSGSISWETCGLYMTDDDYLFCDLDGCTPQTQRFSGSGSGACGHDSGSPFYRYVGARYASDVTIRGIVIAGDCGNTTTIEKWTKIRDTYNVTIMTH